VIRPIRAAKSSIDSPLRNVSESNSRLRVLAFALRTRSTPTLRRMIASHAAFADGLLAIEPIISGGTALAMTSSAMRSSV
jgi:hypothetical protein